MAYADESAPSAPVEVYRAAPSGAPVAPDPMAWIERPAVGAIHLHAPGYRPVTPPPPAPGSVKRATQSDARGPRWVVALVVAVVALAMVGAVLAGIVWR